MEPDENVREPLDVEVFLPQTVDQPELRHGTQPDDPPPRPVLRLRSRKRLAIILFIVTCFTTFLAGTRPGGGFPFPNN